MALEELTPMQRSQRYACIVAIVAMAVDSEHGFENAAEYVAEFEHQDGYTAWEAFANVGEAIADFVLYVESQRGLENAAE